MRSIRHTYILFSPICLIDSAAQQCLSDGTNAYTMTDRTVYFVSTAGDDGAAQMVPIFLDHIFYPLLTQQDFDTEVFHITETGEESGIVYSEMETYNNSPESIIFNAFQKACYEVDCPFRHDTGGAPAVIPLLTLDKVRDVHRKFYTPSKVVLMVNGQFDFEKILAAVAAFEETLDEAHLSRKQETALAVPEPAMLPSSTSVTFFNHEQNEGDGQVALGFRGPNYSDLETRFALDMISTYLTDGSAAPICQFIVESETDDFAADVSYQFHEFKWTSFYFGFEDCTTENMRLIKPKFMEIIQSLVENGDLIKFDIERMHRLLVKRSWEDRVALESDPHTFLESVLSPWAVNCVDGSVDLSHQVFTESLVNTLKEKPPVYWKNLMKQFLLDSNCYEVLAFPSTLQKAEKVRITSRMKSKNRPGLLKSQIQKAELERNRMLKDFLASKPLVSPDPTSIKLILGEAHTNAESWKYGKEMETCGNPFYFVDMKCVKKDGEILFNSEFIDLSVLVPVTDDLINRDILTMLKKEKKRENLDLDISEFINELRSLDFEKIFQKRQTAIKSEMEDYEKCAKTVAQNSEQQTTKGHKPKREVANHDDASADSDSFSNDSEDDRDLEYELNYVLKFVLEHFKVGKLLNLFARTVFNCGITVTKSVAKKLKFDFAKEDLTEQGLVFIDHMKVSEKLNHWAVEFDCDQGLGSSAVFENILHINWKTKKEFFGDSLLLLRAVLEHTSITEDRLIFQLKKELSGIVSDLRTGSGVIPGLLWLERYCVICH
eukprot:Gregarina_sp_Poly_1__4014@NODE_2212_length_2480_cov_65_486531_g310_i3_p1_GENE_NODE_2212_length_2480_cov_65_486531_g310_i3NODE_2212_length_2480_cov_65_486531_g310_i3_p1_ORF_typecomplete_len775_score162_32Peptidase_M16_C/PF05193_21/2_1e17Peptidase_M16/PF00675_20/2_2e12Peptidase_M16/PF00675_20/8_1e02ParB/PF08775_10/1_3_NODE_2212_length_2480_cov_65_486531_g310_i3652389